MAAYLFDSSGDAYDAVQCDEKIKNGDILIIANEKVIGVACTWPVAVTKECGVLHSISDKDKWLNYFKEGRDRMAQSLLEAENLALILNW